MLGVNREGEIRLDWCVMVRAVVAGKAIWEHKLEGGDRVSHVAIWGESIPSRKTSEHKDTGMRMWFAQSMGRGAGKGITNHAGLYS